MQQMRKSLPTVDLGQLKWLPTVVSGATGLGLLSDGAWNWFVAPEFALKPLDFSGLLGMLCLYVLVVGTIALLKESK